ncbi:MAG: OmpH family outer membrane protein [Bacteroidetes bacterium]|nr:OmpH family outer membrane protein [Bacteroidota bacterium]
MLTFKKNIMNKGFIIWNVILTAALLFLGFRYYNGTGLLRSTPQNVSGTFRMAYFEMDSIEANFELVKELKEELAKKEQTIEQEMQKMASNAQQRYNYFQQQASTGLMNESQSEAAGRELRNLEEQMKNRKQALDAEYGDFVMRRQNEIKSKIEAYLQEYNKSHSYAYIVSYEQGLFYYKDSVNNITPDLIKGLNEKFKPSSK